MFQNVSCLLRDILEITACVWKNTRSLHIYLHRYRLFPIPNTAQKPKHILQKSLCTSYRNFMNRFFSSKIMALTRVFFDMEADGAKLGRIIIELR